MRRLALLAVVLALAGCSMPRAERATFARTVKAAAGPRVVPVCAKEVLTYLVALPPAEGQFVPRIETRRAYGKTFGWIPPERVELEAGIVRKESLARNVCAHELGHVLGVDHGTCPLCWMYPENDEARGTIEGPSDDELAAALRCPTRVVLEPDASVKDDLLQPLVWAAVAWNAALKEPVLTVRR